MIQSFDLCNIFSLDSLHDQRICGISMSETSLTFDLPKLSHLSPRATDVKAINYYEVHRNFNSCKVVFSEVDCAFAEIRTDHYPRIQGQTVCIDELMSLLKEKSYNLEIVNLFCGYATVIFKCTFVNRNGEYCEDCLIVIPAKTMEYRWT